MSGADKTIAIIVVTLILTVGGCMTNKVHQDTITKQLHITHGCGKVTP